MGVSFLNQQHNAHQHEAKVRESHVQRGSERHDRIVPISPTTQQKPCPSSGSQIRSRYLHRLGVVGPSSQQAKSSSPNSSRKRRQPTKRNSVVPEAILKRSSSFGSTGSSSASCTSTSYSSTSLSDLSSHGAEDSSHHQHEGSPSSTASTDRSVTFDYIHMETVHTIPSHTSMSQDEHHQQWWEPHELDEIIARNIVEFDYEQWDWQQVVEEDGFAPVRDDVHEDSSSSVLLVHPVHVLRYYQHQQQQSVTAAPSVRTTPTCLIQRQFCQIRKAQQQQSYFN